MTSEPMRQDGGTEDGTDGGWPVEIRLGAGLLVAAPALFVVVGVIRLASEGGTDLIVPPLIQLVLGLIVVGLLLSHRSNVSRLSGIVFALFGGLLHAMVALGAAPWWARLLSGLLAAGLIYAAVLLSTRPAVQFTGGVPR